MAYQRFGFARLVTRLRRRPLAAGGDGGGSERVEPQPV